VCRADPFEEIEAPLGTGSGVDALMDKIQKESKKISYFGGCFFYYDYCSVFSSYAGIGFTDECFYSTGWDIPSLALWSQASIVDVKSKDFIASTYFKDDY
jgi:hypothetical protein